jgi:hypothetical protein
MSMSTTQPNIDSLEDAHTFVNNHVKFHGNLRTQVENQLMVENFSISSVENLDPTPTVHEHASNTVYNTDTHALQNTTDLYQGVLLYLKIESKLRLILPNFHF